MFFQSLHLSGNATYQELAASIFGSDRPAIREEKSKPR